MADFINVNPVKFWCQKVLPLVYDDSLSYYELLGKVINQLNEVIANNNQLPNYIKQQIELYISSGEIESVLSDVLGQWLINVKMPPDNLAAAKGDGATNDHDALQAIFDYAATKNLGVFFPGGIYLTTGLTLPKNCVIKGAGKDIVTISLMGGGNIPLMASNKDNISIDGIKFDGNIGSQTNDIALLKFEGKNFNISNCAIESSYILLQLEGSGTNKISGIDFGYGVKHQLVTFGSGSDTISDCSFAALNTTEGVYCWNNTVNNVSATNLVFTDTVHTSIYNSGKNCVINGTSNHAAPISDLGANNIYVLAGATTLIGSKELVLNPDGPITYKTPQRLNNNFNYVPAKDYNGDDYKILVEGDSANFSDKVNVDDFGAKGDGTTDDTTAFANAIAYANDSGQTLTATPRKTYLINVANAYFDVKTNIDFANATIKMIGTGTCFVVNNDSTIDDLTLTQSSITNVGVTDSRLFNKVFEIISPLTLGVRAGTQDTFYHCQLAVTDNTGKFINTPYYPKIVRGNYTFTKIHDISTPKYVKNVVFDYSEVGNNVTFGIVCYRDQTEINGIKAVGSITTTSGFGGSLIELRRCYKPNVHHISCDTPISSGASGYIVGIYSCSDVWLHDCSFANKNTNSWGAIGVSYVSNWTSDRVISNRWDIHYECMGYAIANGCVFNRVNVSGGWGNIIFNDCKIINNDGVYCVFGLREDLPIIISGTITLNNCEYYTTTKSTEFIEFNQLANSSFTNFGNYNYTGTKIKVNNISVITPLETNNITSLVGLKIYDSNYADKISIIIENSELTGLCAARCLGDVSLNSLNVINCIGKRDLQIFQGNISNVLINDLYTAFNLSPPDNPSTAFTLTNSVFKEFKSGCTFKEVKITNNISRTDTNLIITADHKMVNNNNIVAATRANIATWNIEST